MAKQNTHHRNQVSDYLISVIHLMIRKRISHTESFKEIATKLGIETQTILARCVRDNGLKTTPEFVELVKTNRIKQYLINRYPDKNSLLNKEL